MSAFVLIVLSCAGMLLAFFAVDTTMRRRSEAKAASARRQRLLSRHGRASVVDHILEGQVVLKMTRDMVRDALGEPNLIGRDRLEAWTYYPADRRPHMMIVYFDQSGHVVRTQG